MSFGGSPSQPDPVATATAQANMNHVNQNTPYGSLTYTETGKNSDGTPQYTSDISLTPTGQNIFNQQQQQEQGISNIANGYMGQIQNTMGSPLDTSGIPAIQSHASSNIPLSTGVKAGPLQNNVSAGPIQSNLNYSGAPAIPGGGNFSQDAQNYQNAYMERMAPQLQRESDALDTQLANQGIMPGSQAWQTAKTQFAQQANDANSQAVMGGYQTQEALNAQQLAAHMAGTSDITTQGNFANSAQNQGFTQGQANANLFNLTQGQQFAQGQQNAALNNSANNQQFSQSAANAQLANSANAQALAEAIQQRELPLNEFNALNSSSQIQTPTFSPTPNNTDLSQGVYNNYNQAVGSSNAATSGLFSLGGAGLMGAGMFLSDIRLKHDVKKIGKTPAGLGVYEFKYNGSKKKQTGVMAQEVELVIPEAIMMRPDGYKMVNYAMVR